MSEDDIENWTYVHVKIPPILGVMADKLGVLKMGDIVVDLKGRSSVLREAIARGLRLMMIERQILDSLVEKDTEENAKKIYSSLVTIPVEGVGETTGKGREAPAQPEEKT